MWQGIGPPLELERLGIGVKAALRGVGENLQDHLQIRTVFKCSAQTLNDQVALPCPALPCPALPCSALPGCIHSRMRWRPASVGAATISLWCATTCQRHIAFGAPTR